MKLADLVVLVWLNCGIKTPDILIFLLYLFVSVALNHLFSILSALSSYLCGWLLRDEIPFQLDLGQVHAGRDEILEDLSLVPGFAPVQDNDDLQEVFAKLDETGEVIDALEVFLTEESDQQKLDLKQTNKTILFS